VKYANLSVVFINAIQEQQTQIAALQEQLRQTLAQLGRQQDQLDALRARSPQESSDTGR